MSNRGSFRQGGAKRCQAGGGGRKFGNGPFKKKVSKDPLKCPGCDFTCTSLLNFKIHTQMANHGQQGDGKNQDKGEAAGVNVPGKIPDHIRRSVFFLKDYVHRTDREPLIGLEHVLEYKLQIQPDKMETRYFCDLCQLDSDLVTMLEHVCSLRHRKMYMAKQYPFVLKAPSSGKEDRMQFMRRLAMEIEQEEGMKMYKSDPTIRTVPLMKPAAARQSKQNTRWDSEGDREKRMKKALEYLQSFDIDNDSEAGTVTRLTEKLTAELKFYSDKLKEEALFPAKVARAKDVAMSIMQNAAKTRNVPQNPVQINQMRNAPPPPNKGRPSGPPQPISDKPFRNPNPAFPQRPQEPPFPSSNQPHNYQMPAGQAHNYQMPAGQAHNYQMPAGQAHNYQMPAGQAARPNLEPQTEQVPEEMKFFKKLMTLLKVLPQNSAAPDNSQMTSKLMMLKTLLQDKSGSTPANQLSMQVASLRQDMARMDNASLNQQLNLLSSQNPTAMGQFGQNVMMQMASMAKNSLPAENAQPNPNALMQMAALLQKSQLNANLLLPDNRNVRDQEFMQMDNSSRMLMEQNAYQQPYMEQQPYADMGYKPGMYGREWDDSSYGNISNRGGNRDLTAEEAPYTRVCLSPGNQGAERFQDNSYNRDLRRDSRPHASSSGAPSSRSFDDPTWAERENDLPYGKRVKLESDRMTSPSAERGRQYPEGGGPVDGNAASLSVDLLKRIRGKDLFTVSAILSEYADGSSK